MLLEQERVAIAQYGVKMVEDRLTTGTGGNLSIRDMKTGYVAISPSGVPYKDTKPEDVVVMDLDGTVIEGKCKPSSEWLFHLGLYENREDIQGIVHTHSMYCTLFSVLHEPIEPVHYVVADLGSYVCPVAPYETFGTPQLAKSCVATMGEKGHGVLLANHGLVTGMSSLKEAYDLARNLEFTAELLYRARSIGTPVVLTKEQMEDALQQFGQYGQNENK